MKIFKEMKEKEKKTVGFILFFLTPEILPPSFLLS